MSHIINIYNPSSYPRKENVTLSWKQVYDRVKKEKGQFSIIDEKGVELPYQIDIVDPSDNSLDLLVIGLCNDIPPGCEHYNSSSGFLKIIEKESTLHETNCDNMQLVIKNNECGENRGFEISNSRLKIFFNIIPKLDYNHENWYSGSATSVLLDSEEVIDIGSWLVHDREKRCMQVDSITLPFPAWEDKHEITFDIRSNPYEVVSKNDKGSNRISITIKNGPYDYVVKNNNMEEEIFSIYLYRMISLDRYADYVKEEIFLKGYREGESLQDEKSMLLNFRLKYFNYINIGHETRTYFFKNVPDWLAIGNDKFPPFKGYGFATDVHNDTLLNPHPSYPDNSNAWKSYSWETGFGKKINCIHIFSSGKKIDDYCGKYWYEKIYKPLVAKIESQ